MFLDLRFHWFCLINYPDMMPMNYFDNSNKHTNKSDIKTELDVKEERLEFPLDYNYLRSC